MTGNSWGGTSATLGYRGTRAVSPVNITYNTRNPGIYDTQNVVEGDEWLNTTTSQLWKLIALGQTPTSQRFTLATWIETTSSTGTVLTLTGNSGGPIDPDINGNINVVGDATTIAAIGVAGTNTITFSAGGGVAAEFITDDTNSALPINGIINVQGGSNIHTSNSAPDGNSYQIDLNDTVSISGSMTAGTGLTATTGDVTASAGNVVITAGNLVMPSSWNAGGTAGIIKWGTRNFVMTDGTDNQIIGLDSGNTTMTAVNTLIFGSNSLPLVTSASMNTIFGNQVMTTNTSTGTNNLIIGNTAYNVGTDSFNTIVGNDSLALATTANRNICLGGSTGFNSGGGTGLTTGDSNILIGYTAGSAYTGNESNNIIIGQGNGVVGESSVIRIGSLSPSPQTACFITGIRGATTGVADAVAVLIDSAGQLGTVSSSRRFKNSIVDLSKDSSDILKLRPVSFEFNDGKPGMRHYGLIAEEVDETFPYLTAKDQNGLPHSVKYHEMPTLLLNELIKLSKRVAELEKILIS